MPPFKTTLKTSPPGTGAPKAARKATKLTLSDAIFLSLRRNRTIQSVYIDRVAQRFDLRVAEDEFNPHFEVSGKLARERAGGVNTFSAEIAPSASLLLPTGGAFDFVWANRYAESEGTENHSSVAQLDFTQPLLRGAGRDVPLAPLKIARLADQINSLQVTQTVSETIATTIQAHRAVVTAQEELRLAKAATERAKETISVSRALIKAGRLPAVEIVQSEADLENQQLQVLAATNAREVARLQLSTLLALDLGVEFVAVDDLAPRKVATNLTNLLQHAFAKRPDFIGQRLAIEQAKLGLTVAKNQQLWDLSFFANGQYGHQSVSGPDVSTRTPIKDTRVGLTLTAPLNDLSRDQAYVQASATSQKAEIQLASIRQGIEQQVRTSRSAIEIGWQQLEVARRARKLAAQAIDIEKEKLKAGRSTNFQVRSLETELRAADARLLSATIGYLNALTLLDLAVGTTLDTWKIKVAGDADVLPWSAN